MKMVFMFCDCYRCDIAYKIVNFELFMDKFGDRNFWITNKRKLDESPNYCCKYCNCCIGGDGTFICDYFVFTFF